MFQAEKLMISIRLTEPELSDYNKFLAAYQKALGIEFNSQKEFFIHLIQTGAVAFDNVAETEPEGEVILVETIKEEIKAYADREQLPLSMTTEDVVKYALAEKPAPEKPAEDVVNTETQETETTDKGVLKLALNDAENDCLQQINENRNEALRDQGTPEETLEQTALNMIFNTPNVCNWSGEFYTGFKKE